MTPHSPPPPWSGSPHTGGQSLVLTAIINSNQEGNHCTGVYTYLSLHLKEDLESVQRSSTCPGH